MPGRWETPARYGATQRACALAGRADRRQVSSVRPCFPPRMDASCRRRRHARDPLP
ncbi:hypothetical protein ADP8_04918 [Roseomonas mucosa]|nr:hypothetical protein ADP8_04918 [Roseomonas mucosa]